MENRRRKTMSLKRMETLLDRYLKIAEQGTPNQQTNMEIYAACQSRFYRELYDQMNGVKNDKHHPEEALRLDLADGWRRMRRLTATIRNKP